MLGLRHPICGYRCLVWMYPDHLGTKYRWFGPFLHQIERYSNEFGMKLIASLENCAQVSSFSSITVVRSPQTTSISYYSGPNTSILTICGHRSGGERLIRVAVKTRVPSCVMTCCMFLKIVVQTVIFLREMLISSDVKWIPSNRICLESVFFNYQSDFVAFSSNTQLD